ncbi:LacI family DNA-binding transcriptional regulator [Evansella halocellulosilytica]|uniref:LacI family DNA-binding transcriptional regulator n=1 Tax=Evansella halocellulosilytica TaxID=2011013 RepID=UPI000BB7FD78|nr:LacI family DNA-binding transcriptional regulator [Evansella halocellulosilytica]
MNHTIKDVAKKANVSIATVSRILNNSQAGYSAATKERVMNAIQELGYKPNGIARGLVSKRTKTIGVLMPNVSSMFSSKLIDGIEEAAHHEQYSVIICNTDRNGIRTLDYLNVLAEKKVDGLIFTSEILTREYYEAIVAMNIPFVLVSTQSMQFQVPYVKIDDKHASYHAVSYLIEKGHQKIALISGDNNDPIAGSPRVEGYKQALFDHGISLYEDLITYGDFAFNSGKECMKELLQKKEEFTALFCTSEEMALGAMSIAFDQKIKIPEQISIIGFDNTRLAEMSTPSLTTVGQPLTQMGHQAVKMIISMMENGKNVGSRILPHEIVERNSVKELK